MTASYFKGGSLKEYFQQSKRQIVFNSPLRIGSADIKGHDYNRRVYDINGKSPCLAAASGGNLEPKIALNKYSWRKLTPVECERLQTFPDNYTEGVSNSQRYKMLGNAWTVDVIAHILEAYKQQIADNAA